MALQLGALRTAPIEAGATAEKADTASEEVAGYENRLASVDSKVTSLDGKVNLITWMLGFNLVVTMGVLWRLLAH